MNTVPEIIATEADRLEWENLIAEVKARAAAEENENEDS